MAWFMCPTPYYATRAHNPDPSFSVFENNAIKN